MKRAWLAPTIVLAFACGARSTLSDLDGAGGTGNAGRDGGGSSSSSCRDEIIAKDPNGAVSLAVDGDIVFWASGDDVLQRHDATGNRALLTESLTISSIAVDATRVYYTIANELRSVPRNGGAPTTIATDVGYAFGLVLDGSDFYLLDRGTGILDGRVLRVDASGAVDVLVDGLDIPTGIAIDGDSLYVAAVADFPSDGGNVEGPLLRIPKDGGEPVLLAQNLYGPSSVGVDDTNVYVAAQIENGAAGPLGTIVKVAKNGGAVTTVFTGSEALSLDVTIDGATAYMTSYAVPASPDSAIATLLGVPLGGGTPGTIASTNAVVYGYVRTSPSAIYWTIDWSPTLAPADGASVRKKCK